MRSVLQSLFEMSSFNIQLNLGILTNDDSVIFITNSIVESVLFCENLVDAF